jgi:hypothetical protein
MSRAEASRSVQALAAAFERHLRYIVDNALAAPPGGGQPWDGVLAHYGYRPLDAQTRLDIARDLGMQRGAIPDEVRIVLDGLAAWATTRLAEVARVPFAVDDPVYMQLVGRASGLAYYESERYKALLAPPKTPSVGSIFANAASTAAETPWANVSVQRVAALACVQCGAPQEKPLDFKCRYCRQPMV